jgi:hypothetical protein
MMILFKVLTKKFVTDGASQFQNLHKIIIVGLGYHKFCTRRVLKILTSEHKMQKMASALTFLKQYHKDDDEFLNHIVRVTGDETWVSFVNVETKEQSKQTSRNSLNKHHLPAKNLMATIFLGQKRSADGEIHTTRDHDNTTSVLRNSKKNCIRPFRTKGVDC